MKYLFLLAAFLFAMTLNGQHKIKGKTLNEESEPMNGATVLLLDKVDSSMLEFCITNEDGYFEIGSVKKGEYLIQTSYVGYTDLIEALIIDWAEKEIDVGTISMEISRSILTEVEVKAERIPMGISGDTISYNADAFKTRPNASVEDLLKKLPGIEVEKDGSIKAQGEKVNKVLVDGKEFFGDDLKIATKNLQAEAVDKVKVFDKKSELAEFTGIDDGNEEKTINLELKEEYKTGGFGQADFALGSENVDSKLNYFRFSPTVQASFIAAHNNTNQETFSINDRIDFLGGIGNFINAGGFSDFGLQSLGDGLNTSTSIGSNLNIDLSPKLKLNTHYIFNERSNSLESNSIGQHLGLRTPYSSSVESSSETKNSGHQVNSKLRYKYDPFTELVLKNNFNWTTTDIREVNSGVYTQMEDVLGLTKKNNIGFSNKFGVDVQGTLKRKFRKKGRSLIGNGMYKYSGRVSNDDINNRNTLQGPSINLRQFQDYQNTLHQLELSLRYTEPLSKKIFFGLNLLTANSEETPRRQYFDIIDGTQLLNGNLTSDYHKRYKYSIAGFTLRRNAKRLKMEIGVKAQYTIINGEINSSRNFETSYQHVLPSLRIDYNLKGTKKLEVKYNTRISAPRLDQLMPLPDNRSPNFTYIGNPELNPSYDHNLSLGYNLFDNFSLTNLFVNVNTTLSKNRIVNKTEINQDLFSTITPLNTDKYLQFVFYGNLSKPFRPLNIKYGLRTEARLTKYDSFLNSDASGITEQNLILKVTVANKNTDNVFVEAGVKFEKGIRRFSIDPTFDQSFTSRDYYLDTDIYLPYDISLRSELVYTNYSSKGFVRSPDILLWQLSMSKLVLNNKLEIKASIHDLFDQNIGYQRYGTATAIIEKNYNTLGRFFMLGMNYKIGRAKKQKGIQIDMH